MFAQYQERDHVVYHCFLFFHFSGFEKLLVQVSGYPPCETPGMGISHRNKHQTSFGQHALSPVIAVDPPCFLETNVFWTKPVLSLSCSPENHSTVISPKFDGDPKTSGTF